MRRRRTARPVLVAAVVAGSFAHVAAACGARDAAVDQPIVTSTEPVDAVAPRVVPEAVVDAEPAEWCDLPSVSAPPAPDVGEEAAVPPETEPVALVGDSITWEHADVYVRYFAACGAPMVLVDAVAGRTLTATEANPFGPIQSGMEAVAEIEREIDPGTWFIELGVNDVNMGLFDDGGMECAIDELLELVDPDDRVFWVAPWTVGPRSHLADEFGDVLGAYERIEVLDWPAAAEGLVYDGLHSTQDGARHLAHLYCDALG